MWKTLIKYVFVWFWERADDCNNTLEILLLNLKITDFKSKILTDKMENNVLFIVTDFLYML